MVNIDRRKSILMRYRKPGFEMSFSIVYPRLNRDLSLNIMMLISFP